MPAAEGNAMTASNLLIVSPREPRPGVIDEDHLRRMTLGDRRLEREVLEIFARQTVLLLQRMAGMESAFAAAAAHTLKGSARGVGAWRVARAAERVEQAAGEGRHAAMQAAIAELASASSEARAAIGERLAGDAGGADIAARG
jgi:HPt (histidine-containing phosphotransfer) domain-containing protein